MDATTRWETEAIRASDRERQSPPKPSRRRSSSAGRETIDWVTLREAESETGIPVNTLRKWVRRAGLPSYLEADGNLALRMVDLDAVRARAKELGRQISDAGTRVPDSESEPEASVLESESEAQPNVLTSESEAQPNVLNSESEAATMIVPVDAWNKMLNQLGNLHEAGQQLAEARERAAKAETESKFLRQQLAERRAKNQEQSTKNKEQRVKSQESGVESQGSEAGGEVRSSVPGSDPETTTYWRYLTTGWRERRRRRPL